MKLLQLNSEYLKLNMLPVSLLESEDFSIIVKNSHKIRVLAKNEGRDLESQEKKLNKPFPLKEFFQIKNGKINMLDFSLELIKENQEDIHENNTNSPNNEKGKLNCN